VQSLRFQKAGTVDERSNDRQFLLSQTAEAHWYYGQGHASGKAIHSVAAPQATTEAEAGPRFVRLLP